jgi:hypothetical protein
MRFSFLPIITFLLVTSIASTPVDISNPSPDILKTLAERVPPGCQPGWCTSCPLPQDQCTVVTRRHDGYIDVYGFRWDCTALGSAVNVWTINAAFDFDSQLPYVVVLHNLDGNPTFMYAGTYYGQPSCADSFGTWQCVQQFHC